MSRAFEGIIVLDSSWQGPGLFCTMLLSDLGTDVIGIQELPVTDGRRAGDKPLGRHDDEQGRAFEPNGRNKRSITLNLKNEAAHRIFYKLVKIANIVVDGFRPSASTSLERGCGRG